ncbi:PTS transporter subunit IIC [Anaeromicrobium sediminis]|uniref:Ascorbate-specific PTS system EIIC component n=1 Tax=Anaeromicrobium sediminis TaxID=1478221 RepID=A0A267MM55_9FIRM|nr:PTS transporter subunit IIC [Anaeromicrobium sediminis]PAB59988.1 hypothetical protein CCE28_06330 [Anaeromicrobium sediminis]
MNLIEALGVNIFKNTYLIIAFYMFLGSFFDKKSITKTFSSLFKTLMGLFIMEIGLEVIISSVSNLNYMIPRAFKFISIIPQNEGAAALGEFRYGDVINSIMFIGMIVNLLIAKFTRFKYIFLTGQQIIYMSSLLAIVFIPLGVDSHKASLVGGILLGVLMSILPSLIHPYTMKITKNKNITVGHFSTIGFYLSCRIGEMVASTARKIKFHRQLFVPKKEKNMSLKKLNIMFLDSTLITAIFMVIIFLLSAFLSGKEYVEDISGGSSFIVFSFKQALLFACGVYIVLTGVRMLIQEIIPAFRSVAKKIVPEAVVALDVSILFPYKENIMLLGFIFSFLGGVLATFITSINSVLVVLPSILIHFFTGGGCGIYGYTTGGKKGCIIASFIMGFVISLTPFLLIDHYKSIGFSRIVFGEIDLSLIGFMLKKLIEL